MDKQPPTNNVIEKVLAPQTSPKRSLTRRSFLAFMSAAALTSLAGCSASAGSSSSSASATTSTAVPTGPLALDNAQWNYDADNDVYWQVGVAYCEIPAASDYESLGIYVPGAYMTGVDNGDGTFTCTVNESGAVGSFTAATAPVVMPVNTAGYSAQAAPTSYSYDSVSEYLQEGLVYVYAGCRGRDNGYDESGNLVYSGGAPWGVTDLKAAVRYIRYNAALLPGNMEAIFTFGHSGGGAQSAVMGATGDSALYEPYLISIGAAMTDDSGAALSDAIAGAMCWCPITCLDQADAAYEWMMGQYADSGMRADGTWSAAFSADLAETFAEYINDLGLEDESGQALVLETSSESLYAAGSYYDCVLAAIEESLNNFLADTEFPYTSGGQTMADGGFGGGLSGGVGAGRGEMLSGDSASGDLPSGEAPTGDTASGDLPSGEMPTGGMPTGSQDGSESGETYETVQDYIDSLNTDEEWITYDADTNTATVASVGAFVRHCKSASKDVGAFDATDRSQAENKVFGNDENNALHFDATMTQLLKQNTQAYAEFSDWDASLPEAYAQDREQLDALGVNIDTRAAMYNPLYYVAPYYDGAGSSTVAAHWRVHSGINQGDTALTTELNLALALQSCDQVKDVEFAAVWGQGHTTAERSGSSTTNFITWVKECVGA